MSDTHDKIWAALTHRSRKVARDPVRGEVADRLLRALPEEELSEEERDAIVAAVISGRPLRDERLQRTEAAGADTSDCEEVEREVLQLNRNKGERDDSSEALLDELRREALEDHDEDGDG